MLLLFFNNFKIPKIPNGAGIGSLSYSIWNNKRKNRQQFEIQDKISKDLEIIKQQNEEILNNQNKSFKDKFFDLFTNKKSKLTDESSVFDNIRDFFKSYTDFFINLTLEQQIVLFNFLCSILLLSYFLSLLLIFYGNYLIERFDHPPWRE